MQNTVYQLRSDVEDKINRLPLEYFDKQSRGETLSRVTNDIDNIQQSLQQTMSQLLTSLLTIVGVVAMMFWISPLLSLIALVTIPLSIIVTRQIAKRSQKLFIAQWTHTGALNAQIEEAFTGHDLVKVFGRHREVEQSFGEKNEELYEASFGAQFVSGIIMPAMMFIGNLNYVAIAVVGRPAGGVRLDEPRRRPGLHPVLAAVHPAADPGGLDGQPPAVRRRLGRAGLRAARRGRAGAGRRRPVARRRAARARGVRARVVQLRPARSP